LKKLLSVLLPLIFSFCSLFEPRESAPPLTPGNNNDADSYQELVEYFEVALKDSDADGVSSLLDDDFTFYADSLDSAALAANLRIWDRTYETLLLRNSFSSGFQFQSISSTKTPLISTVDTAAVIWNYAIRTSLSDTLKGRAEIEMRGIGGRWYMVKLRDRRESAGYKTLGYWHLETIFCN
jgi:hypothetical protein